MAYSIDDLTTPLTRDQVTARIYAAIAALGVNTTTWKPGSVVRTMIAAAAIVLAAFSRLQALIAKSGFLETAEGAWLTLVARYVYGVERDVATFAEGSITLTNTGGGIYDLDAEDVVFRNGDGKQYRNTTAFSLAPLATVTIPIRAVEAGSASSSGPNTITELVTPLLGVTATNATSVVGLDEEKDPALRARASAKLGSLSPFGPWDAYRYAATQARRADGTAIGVTRARTLKDGFGGTTTYVATASGGVTGDADDPATDLGAVNEAIQRNAAPLPVSATVASATTVPVAVTYRAWMYNTSGLTEAAIKAAIQARLVDFFAGQPIGGNVVGSPPGLIYQDAIRTAIGATLPQIFHVEINPPAADVTLAESAVATLGAVTATAIVQVPPPEGST